VRRPNSPLFSIPTFRLALTGLVYLSLTCVALFVVGTHERMQALSSLKSRIVASAGIRAAALSSDNDQLRRDVRFLSKVPPIQGMVRAIGDHGYDATEQTSVEVWKKRLQTIFAGFLAANPDFFKVRFISVADDGMELVRVDRRQDSIVVIPDDQLQHKGDRDFFRSALKFGRDQVNVSDITFNRERGQIEQPYVPTMRASIPVFDADGKLFGMIVINRDMKNEFSALTSNLSNNIQIYLTNSSGDYLLNPDPSRTFGFEFGKNWRWQDDYQLLSSDNALPVAMQEFSSINGAASVASETIPLDENDPHRFLTLFVLQPDSVIAGLVRRAQINALLIILFGGLIVSRVMYFYVRQKQKAGEKQAELAAIVESAHDAIIGKTLDGKVTSWNKGAEEMFGYSASEAIGDYLANLIVPPDYLGEEVKILDLVGRGERVDHLNTTRRRKDGSLLDVSIVVSPIRALDGSVIGAARTVRDITEQKAIESQIRELNRTLELQVSERTAQIHSISALQQAILNNAGYAIVASDKAGVITLFNPAAERMLGYEASAVIGRLNPGIFHDPVEVADRAASFSRELGEVVEPGFNVFVIKSVRGLPNEHEWTYLRKDGGRVPVLLSVTALKEPSGEIIGYLGMAADLSERRATELALEVNNRFLDTLTSSIPGMVSYWDRELICRFANFSFKEWYGKTAIEMRGTHLQDFLGEALFEKTQPFIQGALRGEMQQFERTINKPDGTIGYTLAHYIPDMDGDRVRGVTALVSDISELKQAQIDLELLNRKLEVYTSDLERTGQLAGVGAWSANLAENRVTWSAQTCHIYEVPAGYSPTMEEAISFYTPEAKTIIQTTFEEVLKTHRAWDVELPLNTAKGRRIWARSVGELELDDRGRPIRLVGALQDVTERRMASAALTAARDQLLMAAKVAELGIWSWRLADNSLQWNDWMYQLYDQPTSLKNGGLSYEHWHSRVHPDDAEATVASLTAAVEGRGTFDPIFRIVRSDGSIRYVKGGAHIERDAKGSAVQLTGINLDITDQLLLESSLRHAKNQADAASRAKSEFLANMSHEIRTPMNAVLGMTYLLSHTQLLPDQKQYLEMIRASGQSLLSILNDILDFSKIEAGHMELAPIEFDLSGVLNALATIMAVNAGVEPDVPRTLIGDALRLQQVLVNLVGNAIKFTECGEVSILVELLQIIGDTVLLRFRIRDTGIGMNMEQKGRLFTAFSQADASTTRRFGGTGLGLAICKSIIDLMGGNIEVRSELGRGSEFCVTLPMQLAGSGADANQSKGDPIKLHLLVVDDNHTSRDYLCKTISAWGWQADSVESGEQAIDHIRTFHAGGKKYDAVLTDWQMPGMDGLATMQAIRALLPESPIPVLVMASAFGREKLLATDTASKANAILIKPVTGSILFDALHEELATRFADSLLKPRSQFAHHRIDGMRLLLVEDNPLNQIVAKGMLEQAGANVSVADNGLMAVELLRLGAEPYDMVLMDVQMPVMDGFAATRLIRDELHLSLPVLAMTAGVMESEQKQCIDAGMNDLIAKPIDVEQMFAAIGRYWQPANSKLQPPEIIKSAPDGSDLAFDPGQLMELCKIKPSFRKPLYGMIRNFVNQAPQTLHDARMAWQADRMKEAANLLHDMRGSIGTLGAKKVAETALELESAIHSGQTNEAASLFLAAEQAVMSASLWLETHSSLDLE